MRPARRTQGRTTVTNRISRTIIVHAPAQRVWERINDMDARARFGPADRLYDVRYGPDGSPESYRWEVHLGPARFEGHTRIVAYDPPRSFTERSEGAGLIGLLHVALEPEDQHTRVTFHLDLSSDGSFMSRMVLGVAQGQMDRKMTENLQRLKEFIEGGNAPGT